MKRKIDSALNDEIILFNKIHIRIVDVFFLIIITIAAIIARFSLFEFKSTDYNVFLSVWFNKLKEAGGLAGLSLSVGDYTPPYLVIMALLTYVPIDSLISIKIISCIFDFICAFAILLLVYKHTKKIFAASIAYTIFLFAPTVLLNSAFWAQCDVIYTVFLVLCVYFFTKEKPVWATLLFSIALTFKLQAIFLAPFLIFMWLKGKMKFWNFAIIPATYAVCILPALFMGRPLKELLTIYFSQTKTYSALSLNAPNFWLWVNKNNGKFFGVAAVILCAIVILSILYYTYKESFTIDPQIIISFALLFTLIVPFLLPHMHERYFYPADVFAIIYTFFVTRRVLLAISVSMCSLLCYCPYLFGTTPVNLSYVAIIMLINIIVVSIDIKNQIKEKAV